MKKTLQRAFSNIVAHFVPIAQIKPANRTDDEKHKVARFEQFGCTTCHQIVPGKLGLTSSGQKLKAMRMACTDVERIIAK
jgi:hypothetical protein